MGCERMGCCAGCWATSRASQQGTFIADLTSGVKERRRRCDGGVGRYRPGAQGGSSLLVSPCCRDSVHTCFRRVDSLESASYFCGGSNNEETRNRLIGVSAPPSTFTGSPGFFFAPPPAPCAR